MSRPRENRKLFQRVLLHETFEPRLMFNADWQNPLFSLDTNTDGFVSPIDALVVINTINQNGSRSLQGSPATEDFLYDTSGDNFVTPIDVLLVINHLNREGSGPVVGVLAESRTEFHAEQLFSISTGAGEGSRKLLVELESYFPQSKLDLATEDLLCVYIVDATRDTLLDRAETGTSVFTLSAHGAETVSDISTWDGNTLTLDISLLGNRSDAKLLVQLLNGDGKQRTMVRVNSLQYEADPLGAVIELSEDLLPLRMFEGPEVDTSALMPTANLHLDVSNVRYDSDSGEYAADLRVQNFGEAIGRQAVVELAGLPNDATVWNASGISTSGLPYINFSTAIFSGGLGEFDQSYIVPLAISNPSKVPLVITPRALVGGPNMAPTLAPIPTVNVVPGQKVSVVLGGADADGDMLTYTLSDLNSGPTSVLQGNILTIAPAPEEIGTYDMDVIVSDGMLVARQPIKINVNDDSNTNTRITGQVLDVDGTPLVGVQVEIGSIQALTRSDGKFEVDLGTSSLVTDTIKIRGELIAGTFTYPFIAEKLPLLMGHDVYEGYNNFIDRPIFLPKLDTANAKVINPSQTTVVTTTAIPEAKVTVAAGTLMNQQGAPFTGSLSITEVPLERTPAAVPDGLFPDLVVTIQPGEMVFTTPTPLSLPNRAGRLPGTVLDLWSINPTTGQFEIVGQGEVSADGLRIDTISGGIRNSSWHLFQDPDPPDPKDPQNPPQGCRSCEKKGPFNSTVSFQSGAVTETHSLPSYQSLGEAHNVTLYYDSDRADPRPILRVGFDNTANTFGVDLQLSGRVSLTTGRTTVFSQGLEEGTYPFFAGESVWTLPQGQDSARGAVQLDLSGVSTGIYSYVSISRLHAPRGVVASAVSSQPYVHVNTTNSVFGSGWGIGGLKELVVKQGTTCGSGRGSVCFSFPEELVIVDGNGSETRFGGGTLGTTIFESLAGDFSTISFDSANKTFTHRMLDGTTYSYEPVFLPSGQANPSFQLTSVSDRNGNVTTYKYENGIGITSIVDPVGLTTHFEYSGSRVARIIDPAGRVTTLSYDNDGNLISVSDPDSSQRQWQYDSRSHMVGEITKRGFTQEAKYDSTGRVYEATREDGSVVKVTALANQGVYPVEMTTDVTNPPIAQGSVSVASYTDASGNVTRYTIDGRGQSLGARDVFGQTTRSTRDDLNQVVSTTDARLNQTSYNYDDHGNVIEITDTFSEEAQFSPTITWTGAVSEDWSDPGNWDLNRIPSPEDDVLINSSQFTVNLSGHFLGAEIAVRSLQSYASLAANNVTLVLSGQSHLYRGCQLNSAGIYANGPGAIVILDGTTSLEGSTIRATNGGSIKVAQLHSTDNALSALSNVSASGNDSQILFQQTEFASSARLLRFAVEGQNSEIRFEKLAVLIGDNPGANGIRWEATGGGVIAAPLLASATGLTALVDGAFSRIEFSTLTSLDGATIYVYSGGTIDSPRLMSLTRSFLRVRGTGNFPVGQLTNVDGSGISAGEGAKLVVNVATYDLRNSQEVEFNAFALGSEISFPNLTAITDNNLSTQVVRWRVSDGGLLVAPLLTQANRFTASVFDSGSRIELNTIATFDEASIFVYDGELFSPALHSLVASGLTIQGAGKFPLDQLTNLNNSVIEARAGAKLVINSESFGLSQPGFWATGVGAEIRFPNLTAIIDDSSVSNRARWQADSGGLLSAPKLMTLTGFTALVFGDSSRVEFDAIETVNNSQLSVEGDSELFAPHLQILTSTNLLVSGTGTFPISQLSNIDRCEIRASGGAKLVFGVESYELTNVYPYAFSASGNGTEIHFPNLTTITESGSGNAGYLDARGGGLLSVPALRVAARFFATSTGANSRIEVNALEAIQGGIVASLQGGLVNAQGITTATNTLFQATGQGSIVRVTSLANKTNVNITEQNGGQVIEPGEGEGEPLAKTIIGVRLDPWNGAFVGPIQIMQPILESTVESFASTSFSLTASGEQTPPEPVLSQRFAYDPLFNQLVYESDGRGKQTLYKIDPTNGNTLAMTYVVGNPVSTLDAQTLTLGDISGQHTFADVTGDGKQDLIYIDASKVYVAINTLDGFGTAVSISGTTDIAGFAIADLDKNGTSEIYAADPTAGSVLRWVLGTGAGFGNPSVLASIPYAQQLTFGDVDSDNDLDLVVEADNGGLPSPDGELKVHVFANNGSNQFTLSSTVGLFTKSNQSTGVAVVDLDLDGKMDIAALRFGPLFNGTMSGNTVEMLWGNGSTSYSPSSTADRLPFSASHIALRDVDSDGDIDIYGEQFYLLANSGRTFSSGSFAGAPNYYVNSRVNNFVVRDLIFADLNGDGFADRIEAHDQVRRSDSQHVSGRIEFQLGKAGGELGTPFSVPTDINPHDLVLRDFDGDGTLDLSYVSGEDNELTIQPDFMGRYFGRVGDADDSITRYTYTPQGLIDTVTDPKGRITDYDYDALGRLIATTEAKGTADQIISRMEYDPNTIAGKAGLPTATIDPNGNRSQIQYDSMNRVVKTISPDPDGTGPLTSPTTQFEYDAEGNLTKQIDAEGHATTFEYDARNRRIVSIQPDPDGAGPVEASREQYEYDNNGNLVATIDPLGNITRAVYDARNRVVKQIDARGGVTSFEYDRDNNMVALTDPVGNRTTFAYDARNRMTSETDPLGKTIQYIYDGNDNLIEKIDRLDRHTTYGYDDLDRVVRETWVDGDNEILYTYDIVGNLLNVRDAFSEYAYTYDNLDRVLSVNNAGTPDAPHSVLVYTYDSNSKVTSVHDTIDNVEGATTSYVYDTLDRLTMLVQTGPDISDKRVDFSYNSLGQYTSVKRYNDLGATENVINTFYTYDSANRLKAMDHLDPSNAPVAFFHYEYDLANRITRITDVDGTVDYTYDATNQLTTADYSDPTRVDEWFVYDSNGNRLASFQAPSGYVVDVGNRITADGTTEYFYNAEGNLVRTRDRSSGDVINYSWDYRNRLTRVTGDSGEIISSYTYGAENSRLATASADQEDTVWYVYDRGNVLLDGTNVGDVFAADSRNVHSDGLDKLIASSDTVATTNWWITDHVGSIVGSVSEGAASASPQYSAFGVQFESPFLKFSYTGRETESSHDMLYYRARYYSPILGRFLSEDPVRHRAGDSNLYRYVSNSPISKNDPTGLVEWFGTVAILSATGNVGPQPILSFGVTFVYVSLQTKCIGGKKGTASGLAVLPTISVGLSLSSVVTPLKLGGGTVSPIVMNDPYNSPQPDALGGLAVLAAAGLAAVRGAGPTTLRLGAAQGNLPNNALYVDLMIGTTAAVGYSNVKGEVSECCDK